MEIKDTPQVRWFVGDTETCGFGENKVACQLGLIEFDPRTFEVLWEFETLVNPQIPITDGAREIHGISDDMVADQPTMSQVIAGKLDGGLTGDITMVCHNVPFDESLLLPLGHINRTLCTLSEARHYIPKGGRITPGPTSHKLVDLAAYLGIPFDKAHDALADCRATLALLQHIVRISGRTLEQLVAVKEREVLVMPWGCHARQPLSAVPKSYFDYILGFDNLDNNLRTSINKELALR